MRIEELTLTNVCQHKFLDWKFEDGLIGIYGPNGSGKSNSLNVAAYGALTNDYSRHASGKAGMVRQQMEEGEKSSIRVVFTHDGHSFEIVRGLKSPANHLLRREGEQDLKKANEIAIALEESMGVRRRLIDEYVFVGQQALFAFLSATATERAKSFAHLCNTLHAETCWELLGSQILVDQPLAQSVEDNRDELRAEVGKYKASAREQHAKLDAAREQLLSRESAEGFKETVRVFELKESLEEDLPELEESVVVAEATADASAKRHRTSKKKVEEAQQKYGGHKEACVSLDAEIVAALGQLLLVKQKKKAEQDLAQAVASRKKLKKPAEPDSEDYGDTDTGGLYIELSETDRLLRVKGMPECPTCGTPVASLMDRVAAAGTRKPEILEEIREREEAAVRQEDAQAKYDNWSRDVARLDASVGSAKKSLKGFDTVGGEITSEGVANLQADRLELQMELDEITDLQAAADKLKTARIVANKSRDSAVKVLEDRQAKLVALGVIAHDYEEAVSALEGHVIANAAVAAAKATTAQLDNFIAQRRAEIDKVTKLVDRKAALNGWVSDMQTVRDDIMHRDKLPQLVHRSYLQDMEAEINDTLAMFESPFSIKSNSEIGFTAYFQNGTVVPAQGLSGGQKVMLAMAYRLTVNSIFAAQVGMMVLDEPTDGLDADNRRLAAEVFQKLGEVARSRGHQVIVITHDETLERVFDQKFVLQRPT